MLTLFRRNRVFWVRRCEFGKQVRQSLRTRDPQTARALLAQLELDVLSGGRLKKLRWPEFEREFLRWIEPQVRPNTLRGYKLAVERFGRFLGPAVFVGDINPTAISAFLEDRKKDVHPWSKRTPNSGAIKFDLRILHRVFAYAIEMGYLTTNPVKVRNLNSTGGRTLPFTQAEIAALLAVIKSPQMKAIVLTFLHTGLRLSDVINLERSSITGNSLIRRTIKRGRVVSLQIHPKLKEALAAHFAKQNALQARSALVFSTEHGKPILSLARDLRQAFAKAAIPGGHAHRFRDTFCVRLLSKGASLYEIAKLMGISMQTAERHYSPYVKELQERGAELMGKLDFVGAS